MTYETIQVDEQEDVLSITIDRLADNNTINSTLINELLEVIEDADDLIKVIIVQGKDGVFCTGMDFKQFVGEQGNFSKASAHEFSSQYMQLLSTFATTNKIIVAKLDGKVLAGGTGLVAAADIVYSSPRTTFSLSESLWGLLPANVMPYLIRRAGFQMAYRMTITTETINAQTAQECHLVNEILEHIDEQLAAKLIRIRRLQSETIADLKAYFNSLNGVTEDNQKLAINTLAELIINPRVQENLGNFVKHELFPGANNERRNFIRLLYR